MGTTICWHQTTHLWSALTPVEPGIEPATACVTLNLFLLNPIIPFVHAVGGFARAGLTCLSASPPPTDTIATRDVTSALFASTHARFVRS